MQSPCKDCENRHPNCHSECDAYQSYYRANREENAKRYRENQAVSTIIDQKSKLYHKRQKQKWKWGVGNHE